MGHFTCMPTSVYFTIYALNSENFSKTQWQRRLSLIEVTNKQFESDNQKREISLFPDNFSASKYFV